MLVVGCGIVCIVVAFALGWKILDGDISIINCGISYFISTIVVAVAFALFGGFLVGTEISDNVAGVVEFKAEDYYLDYRVTLTQVNGQIISRDTTYVLTKRD